MFNIFFFVFGVVLTAKDFIQNAGGITFSELFVV